MRSSSDKGNMVSAGIGSADRVAVGGEHAAFERRAILARSPHQPYAAKMDRIEGTLRRSVSEPSAVTAPDIRSVVGHQIESLKNHDPGKSGELEHPLGDGGAQRR